MLYYWGMIKAILFDYGGVISKGGGGMELSERLARELEITEEKANELIFSGFWRDLLKGRVDEGGFWHDIELRYGKPIPTEKRNVFSTWQDMRPQPEMIQLIEKLKANYPIGLISNMTPATSKDIRNRGGYDCFDFVILSYEVGFAKPDTEIYQLALSKLDDINPNEVVFIDDQERCLVPARRLGMQTILANNPTQIKKDLEKLLS